MKRVIKTFIILVICTFPYSPSPQGLVNNNVTYAQKPEPSYAKWGRLAMKETKAKYPQAQIIDYLHIGKTTNQSIETEKFKLWLRENQREYGVFVDISFDSETHKVINMSFTETDR
jgi:hypothetical protein